jgi:hypothetical protein
VANNLVRAITTRDVRELIGNPALTNNYLVEIPQLSTNMVDNNNSKLANQGVTQEFAHTRLYADTDFTFYVDKNYDSIKFFEAWMDYISGAAAPQSTDKGYFRRMAYPDYYKVSEMSITKFERNIVGTILKYKFINAFPKSMTAIPVAYGAADLLKVTVSFNYDRYIMNSSVNTSLTPEQQKELNAGLISDRIQSEQNKPDFNGPGSFIRDPKTGKVIGVRQ